VAILFHGHKPSTDPKSDAALKFGAAGAPGMGASGNNAAAGAASNLLEIK
jgi:hypothetical protein